MTQWQVRVVYSHEMTALVEAETEADAQWAATCWMQDFINPDGDDADRISTSSSVVPRPDLSDWSRVQKLRATRNLYPNGTTTWDGKNYWVGFEKVGEDLS